MIQLIKNFFTVEECNSSIDEVYRYKNLWYRCEETHMYVLGDSLLRKIRLENNKLNYDLYLNKTFADFKSTLLLKEKLSKIYGKIKFCNFLSKPGFQIIKKNESKNPSVWHYDDILISYPFELEFTKYQRNFYDFFEKYYVFTLVVSNTKASFDYFLETDSKYNKIMEKQESPLCADHVNLIGDDCSNINCPLTKYETINYEQGSLLIQENKRILHRVGNRDIDGSQDDRISITCYGLVKDNVMFIFW